MNEPTPQRINFDPVAQDYDATRTLPPEAQAQAALVLRDAAGLQAGEPLLDAGVGTGRFALPLARLAIPIVGVDISARMMARLRAKIAPEEADALQIRLLFGDLRHLPLASDSVGAALMVHILHLIPEWQAALMEIRRVLCPGRALFLSGEDRQNSGIRKQYQAWARERGVLQEKVGIRDHAELYAYLESSGATVERIDGERIQWRRTWRVADTLEGLRQRIWSSQWTVPDAVHAELMADTEAWAIENYGSLETEETDDVTLVIRAVRWPE